MIHMMQLAIQEDDVNNLQQHCTISNLIEGSWSVRDIRIKCNNNNDVIVIGLSRVGK